MTEHQVILSEDRRELTILSQDGRKVTARSARPDGFNADDLEYARSYQFNPTMVRGQVSRARKFRIGNKALYLHLGTGPPAWWLPRVRIAKAEVMVGWLRVMVAVSVHHG